MRSSPRCDPASGDPVSPAATVARGLLWPASAVYGAAAALRNVLYDRDWLRRYGVPAAVFSIGNLTVGGTGKTPMTAWLCRHCLAAGRRVAILTRGYRGGADGENDEVRLLREAVPEAVVIVNPDRLAGARAAIAQHNADVLVLDDGFQHRRLRRDGDIVLLDATQPWGGRALLPAGRLRESVRSLRRADAVIITRSDLADPAALTVLKQEIAGLTKDAAVPIVTAAHRPVALIDARGTHREPTTLRGQTAAVLCGIGNPEAFAATVARLGARIVARRFFADHVHYRPQDLAGIGAAADVIVTTAKDWVKLRELNPPENMLCLAVEMSLEENAAALAELVARVLAEKPELP